MILQRSGVRLESLWGHRGTTFWHMKVTLGALWLHFEVTLEPLWAYRRRMAGMMGVVASLMVSLSAPIGPAKRRYIVCRHFLLVQDGPEDARAANYGVSRGTFGHFGVIRGSLLDTLG